MGCPITANSNITLALSTTDLSSYCSRSVFPAHPHVYPNLSRSAFSAHPYVCRKVGLFSGAFVSGLAAVYLLTMGFNVGATVLVLPCVTSATYFSLTRQRRHISRSGNFKVIEAREGTYTKRPPCVAGSVAWCLVETCTVTSAPRLAFVTHRAEPTFTLDSVEKRVPSIVFEMKENQRLLIWRRRP